MFFLLLCISFCGTTNSTWPQIQSLSQWPWRSARAASLRSVCSMHFTDTLQYLADSDQYSNSAVTCSTVQIKECNEEERGRGYLVSCLVDHRGNISDYQCNQYVTKMTGIIFSDYRFICGFTDKCKEDINSLHCGSINVGHKVRERECVDIICSDTNNYPAQRFYTLIIKLKFKKQKFVLQGIFFLNNAYCIFKLL